MNFSPKNMIPVEEVLRQITKTVKDTSYRVHTRGYYKLLIQNCLDELSFDAHFMQENFTIEVPDGLSFTLPEGAFNIRNMWLFNGKVCDISTAKNVYWKKDYFTGGSGYLAKNRGDGTSDPFYSTTINNPRINPTPPGQTTANSTINNIYFFNIQNGRVMLSRSCTQYENVFFKSDYIPDIETMGFIPSELRWAVVLWCAKKSMTSRLDEGPGITAIYNAVKMDLEGARHESDGAWYKAVSRVKELDYKQREDLMEYYNRLYH